MALALNKIILAGANANTAGAYFQAGSANVAFGNSTVLTAGTYYIYPTANVVIQVNNNTNGAAFANVFAANAGAFLVSDGINVRLNNFSVNTNATVNYVTVNPLGNATGQYNT
ncbi:hypothetical protein EBZ39_14065 [bacterium]|jgi:hypothetical protein|nr:hypothetical protein [bacterium]